MFYTRRNKKEDKMTDFEKALEEASEKYAVANEQPTLNLERIKSANKIGARWAREFTVREICEWLESYSKKHDSESAGFFADKIEQHFKDSDRKISNG